MQFFKTNIYKSIFGTNDDAILFNFCVCLYTFSNVVLLISLILYSFSIRLLNVSSLVFNLSFSIELVFI